MVLLKGWQSAIKEPLSEPKLQFLVFALGKHDMQALPCIDLRYP